MNNRMLWIISAMLIVVIIGTAFYFSDNSEVSPTEPETPETPEDPETPLTPDEPETPEEPIPEEPETPIAEDPASTTETSSNQTVNESPQITADWEIEEVTNTVTGLSMLDVGLYTNTYYSPASDDAALVLVTFQLTAQDNAEPLDIHDITLTIDGVYNYHAFGMKEPYRDAGNEFRGTISYVDNSYFKVQYTTEESSSLTGNVTTNGPFTFLYIVPLQQLDGRRSYSLNINSNSQTPFDIEPSDYFQGYISVSPNGRYIGAIRADTSYMFEDSSSTPTDMKYLGKLPYTNAQFYSDDPIVTDSGNIIVLTKNGFLQVYIDNNNGPVWTKTIEDMKCAAISDDGSTIAVATSMDLDNCTEMSIYILNAQNGEQNKKITFTTKYREFFTAEAVALSSNGNFVALIDTLYMYVFDTMTGSQISKMIYAGYSVGGSLSVSHAGDYIGVSYMKTRSITFGYEYYYKTYVLKKGDNEIIWESVAPDNYTSNSNQRALTLFSADSNTFLALTNTRLTLFDSETGVQLFSKNDAFSSKVTSAAISSDGTYILVGCEDETVYLLDQTGTILWSHNSLGSQVAASYDFETIAVSSKYSITVLDLQGNTTWTYTFP